MWRRSTEQGPALRELCLVCQADSDDNQCRQKAANSIAQRRSVLASPQPAFPCPVFCKPGWQHAARKARGRAHMRFVATRMPKQVQQQSLGTPIQDRLDLCQQTRKRNGLGMVIIAARF